MIFQFFFKIIPTIFSQNHPKTQLLKVAILKYNAGNTQSVIYALQRLGVEPIVTDDKEQLLSADKIIIPGVGEASSAMKYLKEKQLDSLIKDFKQPTLGICLGLQLLCTHSQENNTTCLGIFDTKVKKFVSSEQKVPHVGWNTITELKSTLFDGLNENTFVYYVHSFYAEKSAYTVAQTDYAGVLYSGALQKDNFFATQFHPEKSSLDGQRIVENFLKI